MRESRHSISLWTLFFKSYLVSCRSCIISVVVLFNPFSFHVSPSPLKGNDTTGTYICRATKGRRKSDDNERETKSLILYRQFLLLSISCFISPLDFASLLVLLHTFEMKIEITTVALYALSFTFLTVFSRFISCFAVALIVRVFYFMCK